MTLAMPDSIVVANLPPGYPAYLGYLDGRYPTAAALEKEFPSARWVMLTVTGNTLQADGIDVEPGNVNAAAARVWVQKKLAAAPASRPVIYASVEGRPNCGMGDVIAALNRNGIALSRVRLLSAHYGQGPHICGPASCKAISVEMDGTQYTDNWATAEMRAAGIAVDMSMLADNFFGKLSETETERLVAELGIVRQGMKGEAVCTVQGLVNARLAANHLIIDGIYGPDTRLAVMQLQERAKIATDGVVGPDTWPVLLGVA